MNHPLVPALETALGWSGPAALGRRFAQGTIPDSDLCARLLTPTKLLDIVMRRSLMPPQLRCFQEGVELHPSSYLSSATTRRGQSIGIASMRRVGRLLKVGCTLVLDAVDGFDPIMEVACRALQWWSHELVQANTYLTTGEAEGFHLHWDDHDVMILQLAGQKSWEVRGVSREAPLYRDAVTEQEPNEEVLWSGTLEPGDVIHIPRGHWHQATRAGHGPGFSLHVTFGFVKRTGADWLAWVADHSREDVLFRRDLERWSDIDGRTEQERILTDAVTRLVASRQPSEFLAARAAERPSHRHVATHGLFGKPEAVVCVTDFPPAIEHRDGRIEVRAAEKKITFVEKVGPALALLLSGDPVRVADASINTGVDVARLAEVLLQEEICAELTPDLSSGYTALGTSVVSSKRR